MFELNWGIVGLGSIASKWANDLLLENEERPKDIKNNLVAVSSSSKDKGSKFVSKLSTSKKLSTTVYDDFDEFLKDDQVDIVYIASPNTVHYKQALKALEAGKHVLVEKTATMTAAQAEKLYSIAKSKKKYIVEGVWTRFFPTTLDILKLIKDDKILGDVKRISADLSHDFKFDPNDRIFDPKAGGGALMDSLVYSLTWPFAILGGGEDPEITSSVTKLPHPGFESIDETTAIFLVFRKLNAMGIATGSLSIDSPNEVLVEGEFGYLKILNRTSRPTIYQIKLKGKELETVERHVEGTGLFYEIDAVARDVKNGKLTSEVYPFDQTIQILKIFDNVRTTHDIKFPTEQLAL